MNVKKIIETLENANLEYKQMIDERTLYLCDESVYGELQDCIDIYNELIALLRTHQDAQPNEPLTLESLRGMEGQPVWVVGDDGFVRNGWFFISRVTYDAVDVVETNGLIYRIRTELIDRTFKFYRRPPKEE